LKTKKKASDEKQNLEIQSNDIIYFLNHDEHEK